MTPIGNPQNMLITDNSGLQAPFVRFALTLSLPTLLNLIVTPLVLMRVYGVVDGRRSKIVIVSEEKIRSRRDAALAMIGLVSSVTALVLNDITVTGIAPHRGKGLHTIYNSFSDLHVLGGA
jgi:Na+/H+ antiporter NhaD/arsenite permease-like protein